MAYVKIVWTEETAITHTRLNSMETQYDEFVTDYNADDHDDRYYTEAESDARFFDAGTDGAGTLLDADTVDGYDTDAIEDAAVPRGAIGIWSGSYASIPSGWVACDGSNSTPDLRDMFVVGAGSSYAKGATGGYATRTPTGTATIATHSVTISEMMEHRHGYEDIRGTGTNTGYGQGTASHTFSDNSNTSRNATTETEGDGTAHGHSGSTIAFDAYNNLPPYHGLWFIMRELAV